MFVGKLALLVYLLSVPGPWPQFHHDPENTGRTGSIGPETNKLLWKIQIGGYLSSSPVVGPGDTIYIGNSDGVLSAITPAGEKKWEFRSRGFIKSTPAVSPDRYIYFGSNDNNFYAVTPTGDTMWHYDAQQQVACSPSTYNNYVYVGSATTFYAFDLSGRKQWEYPSGPVKSSPAISTSKAVLYFQNYWQEPLGLYALSLTGGGLQWTQPTGGGASSPAIGMNGTVYLGSDNDTLYAFSAEGDRLWVFPTGDKIESSPAIGFDGTIYVGSNDSCLYAIRPDGSLKWQFKTGGPVKSSPAIDLFNNIYFGSLDTYLYAVDSGGTQQWYYPTGGPIDASPAVGSDGTIYVGSWDGYLYAVGPGRGVAENGSNGRKLPDRLYPATPNPFQDLTTIGFNLSARGSVQLKIFDGAGRMIRTFNCWAEHPGYYHVVWDGKDVQGKRVASGIYFLMLQTRRSQLIQKMILFKKGR